jgi:hypothetical protein
MNTRSRVAQLLIKETSHSNTTPLTNRIIKKPVDDVTSIKKMIKDITFKNYFFVDKILTNFTKDYFSINPTTNPINPHINAYKIYSGDQLLEMIKNKGKTKTINSLVSAIASVCTNIGISYAKTSIKRAISLTDRKPEFDIAILSRVIDETSDSISIDVIKDNVVGFIIVERGECKFFPFAYSINLICANNEKFPSPGTLLMGLYLYTILTHPDAGLDVERELTIEPPTINAPNESTTMEVADNAPIEPSTINEPNESTAMEVTDNAQIEAPLSDEQIGIQVQHIGVLELASSYTNAGGLCMYEKFGFEYFPHLYRGPKDDNTQETDTSCFNDCDNLPMQVDLNAKNGYKGLTDKAKRLKVLNIIAGKDIVINDETVKSFPKSAICDVKNRVQQKYLGIFKNIKILLTECPTKLDINAPKYANYKHILDKLSNTTEDNIINAIDYLIALFETTSPEKIEEISQIISAIETPSTSIPIPTSIPPQPRAPTVRIIQGGTRRLRKHNKTNRRKHNHKKTNKRNKHKKTRRHIRTKY